MDKLLNLIKKILPKKLFKAVQPVYHYLLSWFASLVYRWPSEKLIIIGVTGTLGKTTSTYLIAKTLEEAGFRVGYTSTAMLGDGKKEWLNDKRMTMIGRFFTQKMLRDMVNNKCQYAIVETTSEGIKQFRHRFINYDILVFTSLYPEHIEAHGGFENYKKAKGELFAHLSKCKTKYIDDKKSVKSKISNLKKIDLNRVKKTIIVNLDSEHADYYLNFKAEEKMGFLSGSKEQKTKNINGIDNILQYDDVRVSEKVTSFKVDGTKINLNLLGEFNATNAAAAICIGLSQGMEIEKIKEGLEKIKGMPGRFERIEEGQNFSVIVDYAYEPTSLKKLFDTVSHIPHKKIIHVFGSAGGGRDVARRPKMGKISATFADYVVVTNEDSFDDDPNLIINQIAIGAEKEGKALNKNLFKIADRKEGIKKAISLAEEGDLVLISGKGSEQVIFGASGEKIPWDDREVARELLKSFCKN